VKQSNFIFGVLAVAFVVFITSRGSLGTYMSVIFGNASSPEASPSATNSSGAGKSEYSPAGQMAREFAGKFFSGVIGGLFN